MPLAAGPMTFPGDTTAKLRRPWHNYPLLAFGVLGFLVALFRPVVGAPSTLPGAWVGTGDRILLVRPGSPLDQAGIRAGDVWLTGETVGPGEQTPRQLEWKRGIALEGSISVQRGSQRVQATVRPASLAAPVQFLWWLTGLVNVGLCSLALALFWQRPREGPAILLGLALLAAPAFTLPGEGWLLALLLTAHFFLRFPTGREAGTPRGRPFWRHFQVYVPALVLSVLSGAARDSGDTRGADGLLAIMALGYAAVPCLSLGIRWRRPDREDRQIVGTLLIAAVAIFSATWLGSGRQFWMMGDQFVPANLPASAIFAAAAAHLVFRLRAPEVRILARRTLQYLLARWTLGTLLVIPAVLLVFRLGQLSGQHQPATPGDVLSSLLLMLVAGALLGRRQSVLARLDRRFFRDVEFTRSRLLALTAELGALREEPAILSALETGMREALDPSSWSFSRTEPTLSSDQWSLPLRSGSETAGWVVVGPRRSGLGISREEQILLEATAAQAALSLENARLQRELLDRERREWTARSAGMLAGTEEERRRLAADLHDQVLPELRAMAADVEELCRDPEGVRPELHRLETEIRGSMDSVRQVMEALRPSALDVLGLEDALESLFRSRLGRCHPPIRAIVHRPGDPSTPSLDDTESLAIYRICQEAVENVARHSGASEAVLAFRSGPDRLEIEIVDQGRGCGSTPHRDGGRGVGNMRHRAELIGARLEWTPVDAGGTRFRLELPLRSTSNGQHSDKIESSGPRGSLKTQN